MAGPGVFLGNTRAAMPVRLCPKGDSHVPGQLVFRRLQGAEPLAVMMEILESLERHYAERVQAYEVCLATCQPYFTPDKMVVFMQEVKAAAAEAYARTALTRRRNSRLLTRVRATPSDAFHKYSQLVSPSFPAARRQAEFKYFFPQILLYPRPSSPISRQCQRRVYSSHDARLLTHARPTSRSAFHKCSTRLLLPDPGVS